MKRGGPFSARFSPSPSIACCRFPTPRWLALTLALPREEGVAGAGVGRFDAPIAVAALSPRVRGDIARSRARRRPKPAHDSPSPGGEGGAEGERCLNPGRTARLHCPHRTRRPSQPGGEHHPEPCFAASHTVVSLRDFFEWKHLVHRSNSGQHAELERVLGIDCRAGIPALHRASAGNQYQRRNLPKTITELRSNTGGWVACEIGILMIRDAKIAAASGHAAYNVL